MWTTDIHRPNGIIFVMNFQSIKTVLLDGDGVLWHGRQPVPGIRRFFDVLAERGLRWGLITNNATRSAATVVEKLKGFGVAAHPDSVFTSALATADYLKGRLPDGATIFVVGEDPLKQTLAHAGYVVDTGLDVNSDAVAVVAGLDRQISYDKLKKAMRLIRGGSLFVATNPDTTYPDSDGLSPGAWAIIAAIISATDVQPVIMGKPDAPLFNAALARLGAQVESTVMVGDRLETDILGGKRLGLATILVLSGISRREDIERLDIHPDLVVNDLKALTACFETPAL